MSKLEEAKAMVRAPGFASNAAIAATIGCDEGMVRRARAQVQVEILAEEIESLRKELATYRRIYLPKPCKPRADVFCPLWEQIINDVPTPTIHMIGEKL